MKLAIVGTILDDRDPAGIIVEIGGRQVPLSRAALDAASTGDPDVVAVIEADVAKVVAAKALKDAEVPPRRNAQ